MISQNGAEGYDIGEAEMLARKCLQIYERIYHHDSNYTNLRQVYTALNILSDILEVKGNHDDERKNCYERILALSIGNDGVDCHTALLANDKLSTLCVIISGNLPRGYARLEQLRAASSYCNEAIRINSKINHSNIILSSKINERYELLSSTINELLKC